jgi:hypothetical protein
MTEQLLPEGGLRSAALPEALRSSGAPSSSRMFASYLTDIEQLLDAHARDAALREALDLPRLAVAISDPKLRCCAGALVTWCAVWVRPPGADRDAQGLEYERLGQRIQERVSQLGADRVPLRALRRLQLHRYIRTPAPRGFRAARGVNLSAREGEGVAMCTALLQAARRWYARHGCRDGIVQANLARLAVLR